MTLHPAFVSTLIDTNDACAISGTMCAICASFGSHGIFISQVSVDFKWVPSGWLMVSRFDVGCLFQTLLLGSRKCHVSPASAIAISIAIFIRDVLNIFFMR